MIKKYKAFFLTLGMGAIFLAPQNHAEESDRGRMLYENHCLECHKSRIHIREQRKVHSLRNLDKQINRWAKEKKLDWKSAETKDVSIYLNQIFYKFDSNKKDDPTSISIKSSVFKHNEEIPTQNTCDGKNISPPLFWSNLPRGTKSLALIVDNPDAPDPVAPKMTWVHWVLYNIPAETIGLAEAVTATNLPSGTKQGLNDWKKTGYGGPCPPIGRHRYFHKLYALDRILPNLKKPTKSALEKAMQGHIIQQIELMGTYKRH